MVVAPHKNGSSCGRIGSSFGLKLRRRGSTSRKVPDSSDEDDDQYTTAHHDVTDVCIASWYAPSLPLRIAPPNFHSSPPRRNKHLDRRPRHHHHGGQASRSIRPSDARVCIKGNGARIPRRATHQEIDRQTRIGHRALLPTSQSLNRTTRPKRCHVGAFDGIPGTHGPFYEFVEPHE